MPRLLLQGDLQPVNHAHTFRQILGAGAEDKSGDQTTIFRVNCPVAVSGLEVILRCGTKRVPMTVPMDELGPGQQGVASSDLPPSLVD